MSVIITRYTNEDISALCILFSGNLNIWINPLLEFSET